MFKITKFILKLKISSGIEGGWESSDDIETTPDMKLFNLILINFILPISSHQFEYLTLFAIVQLWTSLIESIQILICLAETKPI